MSLILKKLFLNIFFNSFLFLVFILIIQNSSNKSKVNLIFNETINLPVSFILASSYISGSIFGSIITLNLKKRNKYPL